MQSHNNDCLSHWRKGQRNWLGAGAAAAAMAMFAASAFAQGPPGFSAMDKSDPTKSKQAQDLKPHPVPPTVTSVDKLPIDKIKLPAGFKAEVWSSGHPGGRTMVMGPKGTMFMGSRTIGRVYAISDEGGKRHVRTLFSGLTQPNGLVVKDGSLYVLAINRVLRYDNIEDKLDNPGTPVDLTPNEYKLLVALARYPGRAYSRFELVNHVQGFDFEGFERTIDAHVKNLRKKIEPDPRQPRYIETVFGVGYRLARTWD